MDNTNHQNAGGNPELEKTSILSAGSTAPPSDKTTISAAGAPTTENTKVNERATEPSAPSNQQNQSDPPPANAVVPPLNNETKFTKGTVITTGVVAGTAGVAAGAAFSEEIKSTFEVKPSEEPQDTPETNGGIEGATDVTEYAQPVSMEINSFDGEGNRYTVNILDWNGDGVAEIVETNATLVDGTEISITQYGGDLNPSFIGEIEIAGPADFTHPYEIQYGDTLSEIAAAHHTSLVRIMELNPHITDPNVIMAGDNIIIPDNDHIDNPYEGFNFNSPLESNEVLTAEISDSEVFTNVTIDEITGIENASGSQDNIDIDYGSFDDQPVSESDADYISQVNGTDFGNFGSTDNYVETGNDELIGGFL